MSFSAWKPNRINYHGRTPYQKYLCATVMHTPHRCCGGGGLNVTYNFNGGSICGGGFWGGFLGGIGMSIGNMLGGLLGFGGGDFGGWGNWCSGWGGGSGSGFLPISNFWNSPSLSYNCNPLFNLFSKKDKTEKPDKSDGKGGVEKAEPITKTVEVEKEDKDQNIIIGFGARVKKLLNEPDADKAKILYNEIVAKINKPEDDTLKDQNIKMYKNLLGLLNNNKIYTVTLKADNKDDEEPEAAKIELKTSTPSDVDASSPIKTQPVETKIDVNKKDIEELTPGEINGLTPEQAKTILGDRINKKVIPNTVKVPRSYNELLLADKTGLDIQFCHNTKLKDGDEYIKGKIIDSKIEEKGGKYYLTVNDKNGEYSLEFDFKSKKVNLISSKSSTYTEKQNGVSYDIKEKSEYATREDTKGAVGKPKTTVKGKKNTKKTK